MYVACKGIVNLFANCNLNVYCFRARCIHSMFLLIKCFGKKLVGTGHISFIYALIEVLSTNALYFVHYSHL